MRLRSIVAVVALAAGLGVASLHGQPESQVTYLTFSGPVELPGGTVLQPGQYTFRLANTLTSRHIIEVYSGRDDRHITTVLAIPANRREPADETVVTFKEMPASRPAPLQYWYYPGDTIGHEFVYPREQGLRIAQATQQPVLVSDASGTDAESLSAGQLTRVGPDGQLTPYADNSDNASQSRQAARADQSDRTDQMSGQSAQQSGQTPQNAQSARSDSGSLTPRPVLGGERGGAAQPSQMTGTSGQGASTQASSSPTAQGTTPGSSTGHGMTTASGETVSSAQSGTSGSRTDASGSDYSTSQSPRNGSRSGRLPQTGSNEPLIAVLGLFALVGAAAIRFGVR